MVTRKFLFDLADESERRSLRPCVRCHVVTAQPLAESGIEDALVIRSSIQRIDQVVGDRIQHAVRKQPLSQADGKAEQHLKVVADPDVAHRLPEIVKLQRRIECARLARKRDGRLVEGIAKEQTSVAVGPAEASFAEILECGAQSVSPHALFGRLFGMLVNAKRDLVDQMASWRARFATAAIG